MPVFFCSGSEKDSPRAGEGREARRSKMAASLWLSCGGKRVARLLLGGRPVLGAGVSFPARGGWRHLHGTRELLGE